MSEELLKKMLRLKLGLAHRAMELLPEAMQTPVKELETQLMQALHDITKEYVQKGQASNSTEHAGELKPIDIL